jgi:hypothetical protein
MLGKTPALQRKHVERELVKILGSISYSIAFTSSTSSMPPESPPVLSSHFTAFAALPQAHGTFHSKRSSPQKQSKRFTE